MRLFECQSCGNTLYFENTRCERCGHGLGFLPAAGILSAVEPEEEGLRALADGALYRACSNATLGTCNWLVPIEEDGRFCRCCRHNRRAPNLDDPKVMKMWRTIEFSQHRLFVTLLRLNLPLPTREEDPEAGLVFDVLADPKDPKAPRVLTGHDKGLITFNLAEGDDAERERRRVSMGEPYRTMLGHMRHEIAHFFWDRLVRDAGQGEVLYACRQVFGDPSVDYAAALKTHYESGPPDNWQEHYVSAYATSHPWEDFAETTAHYLHMVDTLETAFAYGMRLRPNVGDSTDMATRIDFDPHEEADFDRIIHAWLPLTFAMNSLNRSMGLSDLYPFLLSQPVIEKLRFIHGLLHPAASLPEAESEAA
ncbi:hypothetical protein C8P66_11549 [Humitalea rosea]|uniref:Zinc-ribbon domain-containing protein n=1 Tax=Humitalea rosea TaxID=990373 RepID=A0A2W7IBW5_9PROT|nr:putative zinc-binding peptidase [Humitalea rosea]PZW43588.1 hypothetical protein C8P66_11549 [Humitalea rosea]